MITRGSYKNLPCFHLHLLYSLFLWRQRTAVRSLHIGFTVVFFIHNGRAFGLVALLLPAHGDGVPFSVSESMTEHRRKPGPTSDVPEEATDWPCGRHISLQSIIISAPLRRAAKCKINDDKLCSATFINILIRSFLRRNGHMAKPSGRSGCIGWGSDVGTASRYNVCKCRFYAGLS